VQTPSNSDPKWHKIGSRNVGVLVQGDWNIMRRVVLSALVLGSWMVLSSPAGAQNPGGSPDAKKMKNPVASSPASIAAGKAAFQKNCRFCHGADAKGNGPMAPEGTHPSNLIDDKWDRGDSDGEIFAVIRDGAGPKFDMKGFKSKMTEPEIWNIVNYLRSLQAK
jgi:mono/diheme cytochrome c family protein